MGKTATLLAMSRKAQQEGRKVLAQDDYKHEEALSSGLPPIIQGKEFDEVILVVPEGATMPVHDRVITLGGRVVERKEDGTLDNWDRYTLLSGADQPAKDIERVREPVEEVVRER